MTESFREQCLLIDSQAIGPFLFLGSTEVSSVDEASD